MFCHRQWSVEGLAHRTGEARCAAGLSLSHEDGRVAGCSSIFISELEGLVQLTNMSRGGAGFYVWEAESARGLWSMKDRVKSPHCGAWCKGEATFFFS